MMYVLYLLVLYHHLIACFLWFLFSYEKFWVPPKEFGNLFFDYVETATIEHSFSLTYFNMFYHSTFVFNMIDVAPVTYMEISCIVVVMIISAIANALLYGTFFNLRDKQNE